MNRTERLLDLITYLLNAKEPVSWRKIKNHFPEDYSKGIEESNQRKFERDKAELISLGIPIDYQGNSETQKEGYLIRKDKLFLPELQLSAQESSLLMLSAGAVLSNEAFPYRESLESALLKIVSLQSQVPLPPEEIAISYRAGVGVAAESNLLSKLQDALDRRKRVHLLYHAFSTGETTERDVDPYGLIFRRGQWALVGWDHLREDIRSFVVSRVQSLEVNPRRPGTADYEIPEDFSLKAYQDQQPWELRFHEPVPVTIRVSEHRMNELLPQLVRATPLGERKFLLQVCNCSGLISWCLSQKTDVEIVEPEEMKKRIGSVLRKLI